jgi:CTP:molybdopterin cytidylyltransferase MocA
MPVAAIVLAAGASRRLGQPKQLLRLGAETLLERVIRLAAEAGATPVFVVLGAHSEQVSAAVPLNQRPQVIPVINSAWEQGIASSICAALSAQDASAPQATGALILSCDQPRLTAAHLRALLESFAAQPAPAIVASAYAGVLGIPAVFPREVFADLRALRGDKGARALLVQPPCPLLALSFPGGEIDIDEPADLAQLES